MGLNLHRRRYRSTWPACGRACEAELKAMPLLPDHGAGLAAPRETPTCRWKRPGLPHHRPSVRMNWALPWLPGAARLRMRVHYVRMAGVIGMDRRG